MPKRKSNLGGARAGAGRPPIHGDRMVSLVLRVPPAIIETARARAEERDVSPSVVLREALELGLSTPAT